MKKIFIDGRAGTTGLRIYDRLQERDDLSIITLSEEERKDEEARRRAINESDISFLCLPDAAAVEAVEFVENPDTVIIDTSTAHRTAEGWTYGFVELNKSQAEQIAGSKRIAVPGCHASGFISLVAPLVQHGLISEGLGISCFTLTGYSGGGKKMIAQYQAEERADELDAPRQYGLTQQHKHLKEMQFVCGLSKAPIFSPIVAPYYSGLEVSVPVFADMFTKKENVESLRDFYKNLYQGPIVNFMADNSEEGFLSSGVYSGRDSMEISVYGNDDRMVLVSRYDNLGKGASGAAIQCMNLVLGDEQTKGLNL